MKEIIIHIEEGEERSVDYLYKEGDGGRRRLVFYDSQEELYQSIEQLLKEDLLSAPPPSDEAFCVQPKHLILFIAVILLLVIFYWLLPFPIFVICLILGGIATVYCTLFGVAADRSFDEDNKKEPK